MTKIVFVCHGNICRSPMAEFIFKELVRKRGLDGEFFVESRATSTEEIWNGVGNPIYPPAADELKRNGIPFEKRRATQLKKDDLTAYDLFIGMDNNNIRNMHRILGKEAEDRIYRLMDFTLAKARSQIRGIPIDLT